MANHLSAESGGSPPAGGAPARCPNAARWKFLCVGGRLGSLPFLRPGRTVAITGKLLKIASVFDEEAIDGEVIKDPEAFRRDLGATGCGADIFTFSQRIPDTNRNHSYPFEMDNSAVVRVTTYEDWVNKRIGTDVKQNVKKSAKRGVVVRVAPFDDRFVQGIVDIYNESPVRQGRAFWHYGKDFATIKNETAHCLEKSEFIGAYCGEEMIGFVKLLRIGVANDLVLIVSKQSHFDKKPTNALIAKAVEVCAQKGVPYLTYAKFAYGNKATSSLVEFKRRHGFERVNYPRIRPVNTERTHRRAPQALSGAKGCASGKGPPCSWEYARWTLQKLCDSATEAEDGRRSAGW